MKRAYEINPQLDSRDFQSSAKAYRDFATGKQGDTVRSFSVAISHLSTLDKAVEALQNNDVRALNYLANKYATEAGRPAPTNFETIKHIVADEIVKAILGSGPGALRDRLNAAKTIASYNSPAQLRGSIAEYKELMAGQLAGYRRQYERTTKRKDFDSMLSPEALSLKALQPEGATDTAGGWRVVK
jgi:hypothetical protein